MLKAALVLSLCATLAAPGLAVSLRNIFHHGHDAATTTTTTTSEAPTTPGQPLYTANHVPAIEPGCWGIYECKKKLRSAEAPKPCLKFCLKFVQCEDGSKTRGKAGECVELNEELVEQEYLEGRRADAVPVMQVAMIDFPCQPGYLPDHRGRCREIW